MYIFRLLVLGVLWWMCWPWGVPGVSLSVPVSVVGVVSPQPRPRAASALPERHRRRRLPPAPDGHGRGSVPEQPRTRLPRGTSCSFPAPAAAQFPSAASAVNSRDGGVPSLAVFGSPCRGYQSPSSSPTAQLAALGWCRVKIGTSSDGYLHFCILN